MVILPCFYGNVFACVGELNQEQQTRTGTNHLVEDDGKTSRSQKGNRDYIENKIYLLLPLFVMFLLKFDEMFHKKKQDLNFSETQLNS